MKKLPVIILLIFISSSAITQPTTEPATSIQTDYLKKSKNQKTTAWILMGGGITLVSAGVVIGFGEALTQIGNIGSPEPEKTSNTGGILFYTGLVFMAGSFPLFITSSKNKRKANTISASLKMENRSTVQQSTIVQASYPALLLKFNLY